MKSFKSITHPTLLALLGCDMRTNRNVGEW